MYPHFESDSKNGCLAPNDEDVKPATKGQCEQLEKAMVNAGYTFDFDKKELKKLKKIEKNHSWSEEDERKFSDILALLRGGENCHYNTPELFDFLKSLKDRVIPQPKQEWSEEDKEMLENVMSSINHESVIEGLKSRGISYSFDSSEHLMKNLISWFKSLKDRVQPLPKHM